MESRLLRGGKAAWGITVDDAVAEGWFEPNERGGYCHCGCGEMTAIATKTSRYHRYVRGEHHRYLPSHSKRARCRSVELDRPEWYKPNEMGGLCHCGCGGEVTAATATNEEDGRVLGLPLRYLPGHWHRVAVEDALREGWYRPNRNGGYCECGCGEKAPLAPQTNRKTGQLRGEPLGLVRQHQRGRAWPGIDLGEAILRKTEIGRVVHPELGSCWVWIGRMDEKGYGIVGAYGRYPEARAHRLAYHVWIGPVPPLHHVHHRCGLAACANPAHLEASPGGGEHTKLDRMRRSAEYAQFVAEEVRRWRASRGGLAAEEFVAAA